MTVIFNLGNQFWIEIFIQPRTTLTATTSRADTHTLERQGQILAVALAINANLTATTAHFVSATITTNFAIGDRISALGVEVNNGDSSSHSFGYSMIVLMRGHA